MVIRHGEAFSISEYLTVEENGEAVYRPTVHYAYCPADAAIASLHELHMRGDVLPYEEIPRDAKPYLGPIASQRTDWTPLKRWTDPFAGFARPRPADEDVW